MMPPLRSFDDVDGRERGEKKTDDLRAMTTSGPRTLEINGGSEHRYSSSLSGSRLKTNLATWVQDLSVASK